MEKAKGLRTHKARGSRKSVDPAKSHLGWKFTMHGDLLEWTARDIIIGWG